MGKIWILERTLRQGSPGIILDNEEPAPRPPQILFEPYHTAELPHLASQQPSSGAKFVNGTSARDSLQVAPGSRTNDPNAPLALKSPVTDPPMKGTIDPSLAKALSHSNSHAMDAARSQGRLPTPSLGTHTDYDPTGRSVAHKYRSHSTNADGRGNRSASAKFVSKKSGGNATQSAKKVVGAKPAQQMNENVLNLQPKQVKDSGIASLGSKVNNESILENVLADLERKARYYWLLFNREKRRKSDLQSQNYYLLHENQKLNTHMAEESNKLALLEHKLSEIRADPSTLKAIFERLQLLYYQFDTLTQSLAGVCGTLAFSPPETAEHKVKCLLDYLYPCRALDPRLDGLFGAVLEVAAGIRELPKDVNIPPPPGFSQLVSEGAYPWSVGGDAPIYIRNLFQPDGSGTKLLKAQLLAQEYIKSAGNAQNLGDEAVPLRGFILEWGEVELKSDKDRPNSGRMVIVCRYDTETPEEVKKEHKRQVVGFKLDSMNHASVHQEIDLDKLPPKDPNKIPSFVFDVYDEFDPRVVLFRSTVSFVDPLTLSPFSQYPLKSLDGTDEVVGTVTFNLLPKPRDAALPAQRYSSYREGGGAGKAGVKELKSSGKGFRDADDEKGKGGPGGAGSRRDAEGAFGKLRSAGGPDGKGRLGKDGEGPGGGALGPGGLRPGGGSEKDGASSAGGSGGRPGGNKPGGKRDGKDGGNGSDPKGAAGGSGSRPGAGQKVDLKAKAASDAAGGSGAGKAGSKAKNQVSETAKKDEAAAKKGAEGKNSGDGSAKDSGGAAAGAAGLAGDSAAKASGKSGDGGAAGVDSGATAGGLTIVPDGAFGSPIKEIAVVPKTDVISVKKVVAKPEIKRIKPPMDRGAAEEEVGGWKASDLRNKFSTKAAPSNAAAAASKKASATKDAKAVSKVKKDGGKADAKTSPNGKDTDKSEKDAKGGAVSSKVKQTDTTQGKGDAKSGASLKNDADGKAAATVVKKEAVKDSPKAKGKAVDGDAGSGKGGKATSAETKEGGKSGKAGKEGKAAEPTTAEALGESGEAKNAPSKDGKSAKGGKSASSKSSKESPSSVAKKAKDGKAAKSGKDDGSQVAKAGKDSKAKGSTKAAKEGKSAKGGKSTGALEPGKEGKSAKGGKSAKEGKIAKEAKGGKAGKAGKESKVSKEGKTGKAGKAGKEGGDAKEGKASKEGKAAKSNTPAKAKDQEPNADAKTAPEDGKGAKKADSKSSKTSDGGKSSKTSKEGKASKAGKDGKDGKAAKEGKAAKDGKAAPKSKEGKSVAKKASAKAAPATKKG